MIIIIIIIIKNLTIAIIIKNSLNIRNKLLTYRYKDLIYFINRFIIIIYIDNKASKNTSKYINKYIIKNKDEDLDKNKDKNLDKNLYVYFRYSSRRY